MKTALVFGGTGLIGGYIVDYLSEDPKYTSVILVTRRNLHFSSPNLEIVQPTLVLVCNEDVMVKRLQRINNKSR